MKRRHFIKMASSSLFWPATLAAQADTDSLFLFIFVRGGWDPTFVFTDQLQNPNIYTHAGSFPTSVNGIDYISHPLRPSVDRFFEAYGSETCIINGIEVESLTHEACQRIIFTGQPSAGRDDWPALIGSQSPQPLPVMIVSGPSYTVEHAQYVLRTGEDGQLSKLLDGTVHRNSDQPITSLSSASEDKVQQFLRQRTDNLADLENQDQKFSSSLANVQNRRLDSDSLLNV